jgi:hypothetical protein
MWRSQRDFEHPDESDHTVLWTLILGISIAAYLAVAT